jgi:hypothetical protein
MYRLGSKMRTNREKAVSRSAKQTPNYRNWIRVERRSGREASYSCSGVIEIVQAKHEAAMNLEERVNAIGNDIEEPRLANRSVYSTG